ncbi:MAG TPA: ATP-dependent helicase C-terminal domain-containing protein [Vicinamibacterales bacterium]|nr:ATP-dependent helicase C-terminal domain-containing protein [Vicinamibacterales bacterium]
MQPLPIDAHVPEIVRAVDRGRAAVITAAPGAGKTTRVPPALVGPGRVLVLQPRRVAARSIARWIAHERGWTLGREVGWHIRFDRRLGADTQLIVATEGILTARLQQDPLIHDIRTVVIDEFHERSIHADLGLALAREAWRARDDLRLVVMSATLDARRVAAYLGDCPIIDVPGRQHPLAITYAPGTSIDKAIASELPRLTGAMLCFLPGAPEIRRAADQLAGMRAPGDVPVLALHGGLDGDAQDAALRPTASRRIVLATNLAETTLTVPDVTCVIDTGLHKVARYDADRAIDSLEVERISQDSADQRAGRAGRVQAGAVVRLWDERDRLRPHREPEIARVDLAASVLEILAWGGEPKALAWFDRPPEQSIDAALALLARLGAVAGGRLTAVGRSLHRLPLHPRLARMLTAAGGDRAMARACALLSERHLLPPRRGSTSCDLLMAVETDAALPHHVQQVAAGLQRAASGDRHAGASPNRLSETDFRRAIFDGYPDRLARRRATGHDRFVLAAGTGARLSRDSGVVNAEFVVAVDVTSGSAPVGGEALIRVASAVDAEWIQPTARLVTHEFDADSGSVRAYRVEMYDALVIARHAMAPDPVAAAPILADEYLRRGPTDADRQLLRRAEFAGQAVDFAQLVRIACDGRVRLADVDLESALTEAERRNMARGAPLTFKAPSGRTVPLEYRHNDVVVASLRLQDVFGLARSPRIGHRQIPITFELLAPSGRPVQVTSDLESFWARGYAEVRKELRARYPKHKWPEKPT